jgi:hypothetical protein
VTRSTTTTAQGCRSTHPVVRLRACTFMAAILGNLRARVEDGLGEYLQQVLMQRLNDKDAKVGWLWLVVLLGVIVVVRTRWARTRVLNVHQGAERAPGFLYK